MENLQGLLAACIEAARPYVIVGAACFIAQSAFGIYTRPMLLDSSSIQSGRETSTDCSAL